MAARKSCTHLTWAEAKGKPAAGTSSSGRKPNLQKVDHGKLLAAKTIAKGGPSQSEAIKNRQAARFARRDQQRQEQLEAQRQVEKERQRMEAVAQPNQQALDKLEELAVAYLNSKTSKSSLIPTTPPDSEDLPMICESKTLQLDEIMALQAIFADSPDTLVVADDCRLEELQQNVEEWQMDATSSLESSVASHPPLRIVMKRSIDDPKDDDWVAHCLLEIVFPHDYPTQVTPPHIRVEWFLLTQKSLVVAENKPLESLGTLDESSILEALNEQAQELMGMPCLYEILDTWWSENLFEYISLNPILP